MNGYRSASIYSPCKASWVHLMNGYRSASVYSPCKASLGALDDGYRSASICSPRQPIINHHYWWCVIINACILYTFSGTYVYWTPIMHLVPFGIVSIAHQSCIWYLWVFVLDTNIKPLPVSILWDCNATAFCPHKELEISSRLLTNGN